MPWLIVLAAVVALVVAFGGVLARRRKARTDVRLRYDTSASNLMAVLRESEGENRAEDTLTPFGPVTIDFPDGTTDSADVAWFCYLGDMHVRFVFDGPTGMLNATLDDLRRLRLTAEAALKRAVENLRRVYGAPTLAPWNDVTEVRGKDPNLSSSYFLDRGFWRGLLKRHPEGLVALVAKRGGLLYAPLADEQAVAGMRAGVGFLHRTSEELRVSSALYLFRDDRWTVFQPPVGAGSPG